MGILSETGFITDEFMQGYRQNNIVSSLVTAPSKEPVSLDEIKLSLRVDGNDYDSELIPMIQEARKYVEKMTSMAFITQTWNLVSDRFMSPFYLPYSPVQSVSSVTYVDTSGVTQTLSSSYYTLDSDSNPARLVQAYGYSYPSVYPDLNSITIKYISGYGNDPSDVPESVKRLIKLYCQWQFDSDSDSKGILDMLINQDKIQWF